MSFFSCNCKCRCALFSAVAALVLGVVAAFLQISGTVTVTPVFLWAALAAAVIYLGLLLVATALAARCPVSGCVCATVSSLLAGLLGTILFAAVLLAVGIVATSVVSAILFGLVVGFATLALGSTACFVKYLAGCP